MSTTNYQQGIFGGKDHNIEPTTDGQASATLRAHDKLLPDIEGIDTEQGMQNADGMRELYLELLEMFVVDYADFSRDFMRHLSCEAWEDALRLAHTLKGVTGVLGISGVSAQALEIACKQKNSETALQRLTVVAEELSPLLAALQRFFANR